MPSLSLIHAGATHQFELLRKVSKDDLYGRVKKVVEKEGETLQRGFLGPDGSVIPARALSSVRLDPEGSLIEKEETYFDGVVAVTLPSSFEEAAPLEPVPLTSLVGFCVTDVYPLQGEGVAAGLYRTWFSYRKSPERKEAMLLVKEGGTFLLVGAHKMSPFVGQTVVYDFFDAVDDGDDGDEDEELDFAMM